VIDLMGLSLFFRGVMLRVCARGQIPAKAHRDGAGDDLG
jgi:hypothetical protein